MRVVSLPLSSGQRSALALAADGRLSSWAVASGTLGSLKKRGLVEEVRDGHEGTLGRLYRATETGRAALSGAP